ncbi:MAG: hypothetical protein GXP08_09225 [Gammaproteobacteria bacterium]|nr:hypothetical protein [Gammaproteobacteria bacterium]
MMSSSLYSALLLSLTGLFCLLIVLIPLFEKNYKKHQERRALRRTVAQFRLFKMLSYLGVNFDQYINKIPPAIILKHIADCETCPNTTTCDKCLRDGQIINDMGFCPNYQSLTAQSKTLFHTTSVFDLKANPIILKR